VDTHKYPLNEKEITGTPQRIKNREGEHSNLLQMVDVLTGAVAFVGMRHVQRQPSLCAYEGIGCGDTKKPW
jgi:hypothetical protein